MADVAMSRSASTWWRSRWALVVGLGSFLVYAPSLSNGFALDDLSAVAQDTRLRTLQGLPRAFTEPYIGNLPPARSPYRPVTTLSYWVSWQTGGGDAFAFHIFNVGAHAVASLLVGWLLVSLGAATSAAGVAALLFAVHPVHVEAVANIVGRADVLMTLFSLLGVAVYLSSELRPASRTVGVSVAYLLALGAKENGYVLPLFLVLVEVARGWGEAGPNVRDVVSRLLRSWPVHVALALTLTGYLLVRQSVLGSVVHFDIATYMATLPTWLRVATAVANLSEVARLLLFPYDLSWHYGPAVINPAGPYDLRFWVGVGTCVAAVAIVARTPRAGAAGRWLVLGIGWVAAAYALVSNVVLPMPMWLAERTLYLPSVGVALLVVAATTALTRRGIPVSHRAAVASIGLLVVLGGWRTVTYSRVWESTDTLYAYLVERHPESYRAAWWAGQRLVDAGQLEPGLTWLEHAIAVNPNEAMLRVDYARALLLTGRIAEAEELLRGMPKGLHPAVSALLARSLVLEGRPSEARAAVEEGLEYFPGDEALAEQLRALDALAPRSEP